MIHARRFYTSIVSVTLLVMSVTAVCVAMAAERLATTSEATTSQTDVEAAAPAAAPPLTVHLRESQRTITLAPGERDLVASTCNDNEAVVGGGPTGVPSDL